MYLNLIAKMNIIVKNNIYNGFYGKLLLKIDYQQRLYIRIVVDKSVRKKNQHRFLSRTVADSQIPIAVPIGTVVDGEVSTTVLNNNYC
jgi:hypothetical protein